MKDRYVHQSISDQDTSRISPSVYSRFHIESFSKQNGVMKRTLEHDGKRLLLLHEQDLPGISDEHTRIIIDTHTRISKREIYNNCYSVAAMAVFTQVADGAMHTEDGAFTFVGFNNHCLNYRLMEDGSVLAYDITAGVNIDRNSGDFSVLAFYSYSLAHVTSRLSVLYGGYWKLMDHDEIIDIYLADFADTTQEGHAAVKRLNDRWVK